MAFRNIREVAIYDQETHQVWLTPYSTSSDSIALIVSMELSFFTDNNINHGMMNEAWATSPRDPILANEIIDIRLFCDKPIYAIPAGTNQMLVQSRVSLTVYLSAIQPENLVPITMPSP